jgi:hypothetical protein
MEIEDEKSEKGIPVLVHLRSVGEAPSLKKFKFKIDGLKTVFEVLHKQPSLKTSGAELIAC